MGDATSSGDGKCIGEQYIGGQCIGGDPDCDYGCDWEKEQETKTTPKEAPLNIEWTPTVRGRWRIDEISMWLQSLNPPPNVLFLPINLRMCPLVNKGLFHAVTLPAVTRDLTINYTNNTISIHVHYTLIV